MSTKLIYTCALVLAVVGAEAARAQDYRTPPGPNPEAASVGGQPEAVPPGGGPLPIQLSRWETYVRPDCCGPVGGSGPILMEIFVRSGISLPVEGPIFGHVLETGWEIEGGGRSLFFNTAMDAAWAIDLSVSNIYNHGQRSDFKIPFTEMTSTTTTQTVNVSIANLNRTDVNLGFGREWYLWTAASACGPRWRIGVDGGGIIGSARADFQVVRHRTDVLGGMFAALHTDVEFPCGCCTYLVGFRAEWSYNWMDVLQLQNDSDLMDVTLLFNAGIRF